MSSNPPEWPSNPPGWSDPTASQPRPPGDLPAPGVTFPPPGTHGHVAPPAAPAQVSGWMPGYAVAPQPPARPNALPTTPTEYHHFWRSERYRWWKGLLTLAAVTAVWLGFSLFIGFVVGMLTWVMDPTAEYDANRTTPLSFLAGILSIAVLVPASLLLAWAVTGQRPKWLTSVVGGMRWRWFWTTTGVFGVLLIAYNAFGWWSGAYDVELGWQGGTSVVLIVGILLITPFQAAGEEYLLRGVATRAIGSWIKPRLVSALVAGAVTAVMFMSLHGAGDPWLNVFYLSFAVCASVMVWRTGGLEAALALHIVNNLVAEVAFPFMDISDIFDRSAGVAGPAVLIDIAVMVTGTVIVLLLAKRMGLQREGADPTLSPSQPTPSAHTGMPSVGAAG